MNISTHHTLVYPYHHNTYNYKCFYCGVMKPYDIGESNKREDELELVERADLAVIRALLRYSFEPISYDFDALTARERSIVGTPEQFARIKQFATEDK